MIKSPIWNYIPNKTMRTFDQQNQLEITKIWKLLKQSCHKNFFLKISLNAFTYQGGKANIA